MATNGDAARLEQVERAIIGERPSPATATEDATAGDVQRYAEALADRVVAAGRYAKDHGAYLDEISRAFAEKITAETDQYATSLIAAERRKMAELERLMGRFGG